MRIDPRIASAAVASPSRPRDTRASGRFTLDEEKRSAPSAARSAAPLATLDAILALQAEEDPAIVAAAGPRPGARSWTRSTP